MNPLAECMALKPEYLNPSKKIVLDFAKETFEAIVKHLRVKYSIPEFAPKLKVCFRKTRVYSWGGVDEDGPFVNLTAYNILWMIPQGPNCVKRYVEYKFLHRVPDIGEFRGTWKKWLAALITHELAHAIQFYAESHPHIYNCFEPEVAADKRPHGKFWQGIYRDLRMNFVNMSEFDMSYKVRPEKKRKRLNNRQFTTISRESNGGRYVDYIVKGEAVGRFFSKHQKPVMHYDTTSDSWVTTPYMKLVDARNAFLREFISTKT